MATSGQASEVPHLTALIKTLTNPQLKDLLRNEGLAVSGVKASLQIRIIDCSLNPLLALLRARHFPSVSPAFVLSMRHFLQSFPTLFARQVLTTWSPKDLERLVRSEGNGARYDALRRRIFQTAVPGASTFQSNPGYQYQSPAISHPLPSQARSAPLGGSLSPHSHIPGSIPIGSTSIVKLNVVKSV